jgi:hypothetical protein
MPAGATETIMKLRIRGNSLRLRLIQSEVAHFAETGLVEDAIVFRGGHSLRYSLQVSDIPALSAEFVGTEIRVLVPRPQALSWTSSNEVSLIGEDVSETGTLKLLIEKDFACLNPQAVWQEDQSDNFPNPLASCSKH